MTQLEAKEKLRWLKERNELLHDEIDLLLESGNDLKAAEKLLELLCLFDDVDLMTLARIAEGKSLIN